MILVVKSDSTFCWLDQLTHFVRKLLIVKTINVAPDAAASVLYLSPVTSSAQADSTSELLRFL